MVKAEEYILSLFTIPPPFRSILYEYRLQGLPEGNLPFKFGHTYSEHLGRVEIPEPGYLLHSGIYKIL